MGCLERCPCCNTFGKRDTIQEVLKVFFIVHVQLEVNLVPGFRVRAATVDPAVVSTPEVAAADWGWGMGVVKSAGLGTAIASTVVAAGDGGWGVIPAAPIAAAPIDAAPNSIPAAPNPIPSAPNSTATAPKTVAAVLAAAIGPQPSSQLEKRFQNCWIWKGVLEGEVVPNERR